MFHGGTFDGTGRVVRVHQVKKRERECQVHKTFYVSNRKQPHLASELLNDIFYGVLLDTLIWLLTDLISPPIKSKISQFSSWASEVPLWWCLSFISSFHPLTSFCLPTSRRGISLLKPNCPVGLLQ